MFVSRKKMKVIEGRLAELERKVQDQPQKIIGGLAFSAEKATNLIISHTPEGQPRKQ